MYIINSGQKSARPVSFNGLLTNKVLTALSGSVFARLLTYLEPLSLISGEGLYKFGADFEFAYFPETAVISHLYIMEDGSTTEAALIGRDGMVGLSAVLGSRPQNYWTEVTIGGSALRIRTESLKREFASCEELQRLLLGYTAARLAQLSQRAVCNCRHALEERFCSWLLMVRDRAGEDQLPLTHEEISRHLGARRAGVSTTCASLRDNGIITYRRGLINILDRAGLEAAACECYRTLRRLVG